MREWAGGGRGSPRLIPKVLRPFVPKVQPSRAKRESEADMPLCVECGEQALGGWFRACVDRDVTTARTRRQHDRVFLTSEIAEARDLPGHDPNARVFPEIGEAAELIA